MLSAENVVCTEKRDVGVSRAAAVADNAGAVKNLACQPCTEQAP